MNIRAIIDTAIVLAALLGVIVLWLNARETARRIHDLEVQVRTLLPLEGEVAAQNVIIAEQRAGIEKLQAQVAQLETEVATWKRKFDALITWVRTKVPEPDVDEFLVQLGAGQTGG